MFILSISDKELGANSYRQVLPHFPPHAPSGLKLRKIINLRTPFIITTAFARQKAKKSVWKGMSLRSRLWRSLLSEAANFMIALSQYPMFEAVRSHLDNI